MKRPKVVTKRPRNSAQRADIVAISAPVAEVLDAVRTDLVEIGHATEALWATLNESDPRSKDCAGSDRDASARADRVHRGANGRMQALGAASSPR